MAGSISLPSRRSSFGSLVLTMLTMTTSLLLASAAAAAAETAASPATTSDHHHWLGSYCSKPSDCAVDECCLVGMSRYSRPSCVRQPTVGEPCLMGGLPENKTLEYPGGRAIDLYGVYRLFCPCEGGLECHQAVCQPMSAKEVSRNVLYNIDDFDYSTLGEEAANNKQNFVEFAS